MVITQNNYQHKTLLGYESWGEVDSIKHCGKRLPLKCRSFQERSNFPRIGFRDLRIRLEVGKTSIWKHTTSCDRGVFSFMVISQVWRPIELKFSQVCCYFMHMLRYTKLEDWSLTITIVSSAFNTHFIFSWIYKIAIQNLNLLG